MSKRKHLAHVILQPFCAPSSARELSGVIPSRLFIVRSLARKPCGRLQPTRDPQLLDPTRVRRLLDGVADGLHDAAWGSMPGRLYLAGKISATEFAASKRWSELCANYSAACRSPPAPRTVSFEAPGGTPVDPDSEKGEREVALHEHITANWLAGRNTLRLAGRGAEAVVADVCERGLAPAGLDELHALRSGLESLHRLWSSKRKANAR